MAEEKDNDEEDEKGKDREEDVEEEVVVECPGIRGVWERRSR